MNHEFIMPVFYVKAGRFSHTGRTVLPIIVLALFMSNEPFLCLMLTSYHFPSLSVTAYLFRWKNKLLIIFCKDTTLINDFEFGS